MTSSGARFARTNDGWRTGEAALDARGQILAPVYVTDTSFWSSRTRPLRTLLAFNPTTSARINGRWLPIAGRPFLAAATLAAAEGSAVLFVTSEGKVELAR